LAKKHTGNNFKPQGKVHGPSSAHPANHLKRGAYRHPNPTTPRGYRGRSSEAHSAERPPEGRRHKGAKGAVGGLCPSAKGRGTTEEGMAR